MCILLQMLKCFLKVFRFLCFVFYFAIAVHLSALQFAYAKGGIKTLTRENNNIVEEEGNKTEKGEG